MESKVIELDALPGLVGPSASVAFGGSWLCNRPMAAVRELVRAGRDDVQMISIMGSLDVDLLVGAGVASSVCFSMVSLDTFGLAPNFRRKVEDATLRVVEMTGLTLEAGLNAAALNVPFLPFVGLGFPPTSDIIALHPDLYRQVTCPFTGGELLAVRAVAPDVSIVHATRADSEGNAQFDGTFAMDDEMVRASRRVIVTCEEITSRETIQQNPQATRIPGFLVDAVIEVPHGAHPTSHVPLYAMDGPEILDYVVAAEAGPARFAEYVDRLRVESESEYRARVLPASRAATLSALTQAARVLVDGRA